MPRTCPTCGESRIVNPRASQCKRCANRTKGGTFDSERAALAARERALAAHLWRERFDELARREVESLSLSEDGVAVVQHVVRGTHWDAANVPLLWSEVEEAIRMEGTRRWPFDVDALVSQLRALSPLQSLAIVVAFER